MTREIPTIADYAHHNELAAQVWWAENRSDMERSDEPDDDYDPYTYRLDADPTCDICDEPMDDTMNGDENDWNGDTGNHISCEENR